MSNVSFYDRLLLQKIFHRIYVFQTNLYQNSIFKDIQLLLFYTLQFRHLVFRIIRFLVISLSDVVYPK